MRRATGFIGCIGFRGDRVCRVYIGFLLGLVFWLHKGFRTYMVYNGFPLIGVQDSPSSITCENVFSTVHVSAEHKTIFFFNVHG